MDSDGSMRPCPGVSVKDYHSQPGSFTDDDSPIRHHGIVRLYPGSEHTTVQQWTDRRLRDNRDV